MATKKRSAKSVAVEQQVPPFTLRSVYLYSSRVSVADDFDPLIPGVNLIATHRIAGQKIIVRHTEYGLEGEKPTKVRSAVFITSFAFRYRTKEQTEMPDTEKFLIEVSGDIAADYQLNRPDDPTPEQNNSWGASNVLLHTWPYWREFCHSTLLRMSLPATVLPMLTTGTVPEGSEQTVISVAKKK